MTNDGSLVFDTELDSSGFRKGSSKLLDAIKDLTASVNTIGDNMMAGFGKLTPLLRNIASGMGEVSKEADDTATHVKSANGAIAKSEQQVAQAAQQSSAAIVSGSRRTAGSYDALLKKAQDLNAGALKGFSSASSVVSFSDKLDALREQYGSLKQATAEYAAQKLPTEDYNVLSAYISTLESKIVTLGDKLGELPEGSAKWNKLNGEIELYKRILAESKADMDAMEEAGTAFKLGADTSEFKAMEASLATIAEQLRQSNSFIDAEAIGEAKLNIVLAQQSVLNAKTNEEREEALANLREQQRVLQEIASAQTLKGSMPTVEETHGEESEEGVKDSADRAEEAVNRVIEALDHMVIVLKMAGQMAGSAMLAPFRLLASAAKSALSAVPGLARGAISALGGVIRAVGNLAAKLAKITWTAIKAGITILKGVGQAALWSAKHIGSLASKVAGLAVNLAKVTFNGLRKGASAAVTGIKKVVTGIKGLTKHSKDSTLTTNGLVKALTSFKRLLLTRVKRAFISKIYKELSSSLSAIKKVSAEYKKLTDGIGGALRGVSVNVAGLVSQIASAILPALTTVVNVLSVAISYVSALFGLLSGKTTILAAKNTDKYSEALKGASGSAKDLEHQVHSFDELNKEQSKSGGGGSGDDVSSFFEEVEIASLLPDTIASIFNNIKAAFDNNDWAGIGMAIAGGLDLAVSSVDTWITDTLAPMAHTWSVRIADLINGLLTIDWGNLGKLIGDGLTTAFDAVNTFFETVSWEGLGLGLADAINGIFENFDISDAAEFLANKFNAIVQSIESFVLALDWTSIGLNLSDGINTLFADLDVSAAAGSLSGAIIGVLNGISATLENTNWEEIGSEIAGYLASIDWVGIIESLWTAVGTATGGIAEFLWGLIKTAWNSVTEWWEDLLEESGGNVWDALKKGIKSAISGIDTWIYKHVIVPFADGFEQCTDTDLVEVGKGIFASIQKGIDSGDFNLDVLALKIVQGVNTAILSIDFSTFGKLIGSKLTSAFSWIGTAIETVSWSDLGAKLSGGLNALVESTDFTTIGQSLSTATSGALDFITSAIDGFEWTQLGTKIGEFVNGIDFEQLFSQLGTLFYTVITGFYETIKGFVDEIKWSEIGSAIIAGIKSWFTEDESGKSRAEALFDLAFGTATDITAAALDFAWSMVSGLLDGLDQWIEDMKEDFANSGLTIWEYLWEGIKNVGAQVGKWAIEHIYNPIVQALNGTTLFEYMEWHIPELSVEIDEVTGEASIVRIDTTSAETDFVGPAAPPSVDIPAIEGDVEVIVVSAGHADWEIELGNAPIGILNRADIITQLKRDLMDSEGFTVNLPVLANAVDIALSDSPEITFDELKDRIFEYPGDFELVVENAHLSWTTDTLLSELDVDDMKNALQVLLADEFGDFDLIDMHAVVDTIDVALSTSPDVTWGDLVEYVFDLPEHYKVEVNATATDVEVDTSEADVTATGTLPPIEDQEVEVEVDTVKLDWSKVKVKDLDSDSKEAVVSEIASALWAEAGLDFGDIDVPAIRRVVEVTMSDSTSGDMTLGELKELILDSPENYSISLQVDAEVDPEAEKVTGVLSGLGAGGTGGALGKMPKIPIDFHVGVDGESKALWDQATNGSTVDKTVNVSAVKGKKWSDLAAEAATATSEAVNKTVQANVTATGEDPTETLNALKGIKALPTTTTRTMKVTRTGTKTSDFKAVNSYITDTNSKDVTLNASAQFTGTDDLQEIYTEFNHFKSLPAKTTRTLNATRTGTKASDFKTIKGYYDGITTKEAVLTAKINDRVDLDALEKVKNAFGSIKSNTVTMTIKSSIESKLTSFVDAIQKVLSKLGGVKMAQGGVIQSIPYAANGLIVKRETNFGSFIAGEAGTEAVVPLEHNISWLNVFAARVVDYLGTHLNVGVLAGAIADGMDTGLHELCSQFSGLTAVLHTFNGNIIPAIASGAAIPAKTRVSDDCVVRVDGFDEFKQMFEEYTVDQDRKMTAITDLVRKLNLKIDADSLASAISSSQSATIRAYGG